MRLAPARELPKHLEPTMRAATRLATGMIGYLILDALVLSALLAGSQTIMTLIAEDFLEAVAPITYLVTKGKISKQSESAFPYGHHRDVTLGAFASALALLGFGLLLVVVSSMSLISGDHPTIATAEVFGIHVWKGWLVAAWLVPTAAIPSWLARRVKPQARELNNRVLHVAGELLSADWQSTLAGLVGMVGVAAGFWWLDSTAAIVISLSIVLDGIRTTRRTADLLLDRQPTEVGTQKTVPLVDEIRREVEGSEWAGDARVRLRSHGQVFFGDVAVEIGDHEVTGKQLQELEERIMQLDWRLQEVLVAPAQSIESNEGASDPSRD